MAPAKGLSPARLDAFLVRLNTVMQTPSGSDAVLATVCYGARTGSVLLTTAAGRQLAADVALDLAKRLRALGALATELRMMTRLWGMLSMYVWARQLLQQIMARTASKKKDPLDSLVAWSQLVSCSAYQMLENVAYLAQRGILPLSSQAQTAAYLWSSRAFCVYVAVELGRLAATLAAKTAKAATSNSKTAQDDLRAEVRELRRSAVRYMAFAPTTVHWSMEKGFLGESGVTLLGFVPAALQIHKVWSDAAGKS
ncbi:peroxin 11c [Grosmannia clavigera kw1407]|uniref:Peroxin 11c n=1 Tax=Grosmannia clavigera (strain kw1407 / UAMH 11150) TaxID=655863 RepID=F0XIZ5_GROCL|nr:peroxin 11c [Grosmannia clavigera kw1407]EFX02402.1 peroxin 11c [Grosmannia clavigera kw1407]